MLCDKHQQEKIHHFTKNGTPRGWICRACQKERNKNYRLNPVQRKEQSRKVAARRKVRQQFLRSQILEKLGGRCSSQTCQWMGADGRYGCTDVLCLQIDHVLNDGHRERKAHHGDAISYYQKILADMEGRYQLLCANCNWLKYISSKCYLGDAVMPKTNRKLTD